MCDITEGLARLIPDDTGRSAGHPYAMQIFNRLAQVLVLQNRDEEAQAFAERFRQVRHFAVVSDHTHAFGMRFRWVRMENCHSSRRVMMAAVIAMAGGGGVAVGAVPLPW